MQLLKYVSEMTFMCDMWPFQAVCVCKKIFIYIRLPRCVCVCVAAAVCVQQAAAHTWFAH